ncbi:hypothetical protein [Halorubrum aidingense]|uniref:hypothetical protein n=1 Tax=Halorubrum aidingense TaxID=368623 RepID=UPI000AA197EA|nr:hypothetical protein [Halorubrum aidingense]
MTTGPTDGQQNRQHDRLTEGTDTREHTIMSKPLADGRDGNQPGNHRDGANR